MLFRSALELLFAADPIDVREAERITGIIRGSNPNHHESSDTYDAYSEADFRFGFQSARLTLNALGRLAGISVSSTR